MASPSSHAKDTSRQGPGGSVWLSVTGAAQRTWFQEAFIYAAVKSGELPAVRKTAHSPIRIQASDVDAWLKSWTDAQSDPTAEAGAER